LELSCIDPVRRNPDKLRWPAAGGGDTMPPAEFERLCRDFPRLVRRLREQLGCDTPKKVLDFLADNRDIPSRFELPEGVSDPKQALLKPWHKQFPLLPDPRERDGEWPNPERDQLSANEWVDVFVVARTWYSYALKTTPPPISDPLAPVEFDPVKYRLPKMAMVLFASYPARAQTYVAEGLQNEGWFGSEGWLASAAYAKSALPPTALDSQGEFRPGQGDAKYSSQEAWQKAHQRYRAFGMANGIYFPPAEQAALEKKEKEFRDHKPNLNLSEIDIHAYRKGPWKDHIHAVAKLMWKKKQTDQRISLDDFLAITEAEGTDLAVAARLRFFEADRLRRLAAEPRALALYDEAWPLWLQVLLQHPRFSHAIAEDYYEWHMRHLLTQQKQLAHVIRPLTMVLAQQAVWPYPPFHEQLSREGPERIKLPPPAEVVRLWNNGKGIALPGLTPGEVERILPIRTARGMLDEVQYFHLHHPEITKEFLLWWSQAPWASHGVGLAPLVTPPGHATLLLTRRVWFGQIPPPRWDYVMPPGQAAGVRVRLGWPKTPPPWEGAMSGVQMPGR